VLAVLHHITVNISGTQHRISLVQLARKQGAGHNKVTIQLHMGFLLVYKYRFSKRYVIPSLLHVIAMDGVAAGPALTNAQSVGTYS
jgi:hypothetical protein